MAQVDSKDIVVLPKSVNTVRIASNLRGTLDGAGKLEKSDVERLDGVAAGGKQKRYASVLILSNVTLKTVYSHCQIYQASMA